MSKEKELKAMVKIFENAECSHICHKCEFEPKLNACLRYHAMAELQKAGYGDIKQAVREFAEKLKQALFVNCTIIRRRDDPIEEDMKSEEVSDTIDLLLAEVTKE